MNDQDLRSEPNNYEVSFVNDYGDVGCGRVVPFTPKDAQIPVVLPLHALPSQYGIVTVRGPSLEDDGIYDGDKLVISLIFDKKDITRENICVVYIHSIGELQAKKLISYGDRVCLRSSGGGISDVLYDWNDIEIRGVVVSFQRLLDGYGRLTRHESF